MVKDTKLRVIAYLFIILFSPTSVGFSGGSDGRKSSRNTGGAGLISWSGRAPEEENGNPLQYSCLGNPMDRGAWQATWGHKELEATEHIYRRIHIFTVLDFSKIL